MTSHDSRLGALEAWRDAHDREITKLSGSVERIETKVDSLVATKKTASWVFRGIMPAIWTLIASGVSALAAYRIGH